ncbi:MAG: hypothetical protein N2485_08315 [bacterium]|nr:hypothetical protein [bacterium]
MNALNTLYNKINEIEKNIENKLKELILNGNGSLEEIQILKCEKELLEEKLKITQNFYKRKFMIINGYIKETKNIQPRFEYFNNNLNIEDFIYTDNDICDFCGGSKVIGLGIVLTLDPKENELVYICKNCYIERKNMV